MEAVGAASTLLGLAIPVFQCAKALRDRVKLVASEKKELLEALTEYEKDINLLELLYNHNKKLMDQHNLDTDLKELKKIIGDLDNWLDSVNPNLGKKEWPGLEELWKSGDLHEKLVATNAKISSIERRWQMCLQGCTLASTTVVLGQLGETTALLKQVLSIHQQGPVRQRSCSLSLHLQIEPANLSSQTRIVADTTTSTVALAEPKSKKGGPVRQRSCSLSMDSQIEPVDFGSQTRIVTNTTSSTVALAEPKSQMGGSGKSKTKIDKSRISAPQKGSFVHVAHMGYNAKKGFTSTGLDSSWLNLITQLNDVGVDESILQDKDKQKFIVRTYPSASTSASSTANGTKAAAATRAPPPPGSKASIPRSIPPPPPRPKASIPRSIPPPPPIPRASIPRAIPPPPIPNTSITRPIPPPPPRPNASMLRSIPPPPPRLKS